MHQIVITPSAKRSAKKLPENIREEILTQSQKLKENPYLGEKLSSSLHFLYSFHVKFPNESGDIILGEEISSISSRTLLSNKRFFISFLLFFLFPAFISGELTTSISY